MITIDVFHFDKEKSGNLLKKWLKECGLSQHHAADLTGIHQDTLFNCLSGRVQDIKFETVFKIALITGHTVDDYIREMLEGLDVPFYCRVVQDPPAPDPAASAPVDALRPDTVLDKELSVIAKLYEHQLNHLEKQFHMIERMHDREIARLEAFYEKQLQK